MHLPGIEHQVCQAHGIHLGVIEVLYQKKVTQIEVSDNSETDDEDGDDTDDDEDDEEISIYEKDFSEVRGELMPLISKVRKIVKIFRKSAKKNDMYLQKHVKNDFGKEITLILDCKTRWSSLFTMLKRFCELKSSVKKALIDLDRPLSVTEDEFRILEGIVSSLEPIKVTIEALCRRDSTLITADTALSFMLKKLKDNDSFYSQELYKAIKSRVLERRTKMSGLLSYLKFGKISEQGSSNEIFTSLSKKEIKEMVLKLASRFFTQEIGIMDVDFEVNQDQENSSEINDEPLEKKAKISLEDELNQLQNSSKADKPHIQSSTSTNVSAQIKKELSVFETSNVRGYYLEYIYNSLLSIPPTSVESERAFSSAGNLCTKLRASLGDNSMNYLCLLRSYFQMNK